MTSVNRLPYIGPDGVEYRSKKIYYIISALLIFSIFTVYADVAHVTIKGYGITEFLINFEGGYVRRGLLGQLLFWLCDATHLNPVSVILTVSILFFVGVFWFFLRKTIKEGYSWWFLFSGVALGFTVYIVRKDYMEYAVLIGILLLLQSDTGLMVRKTGATILAVFGLLLHEAFFFWGLPIYALIMLQDRKHMCINIMCIFVVCAVFALQCLYKGSETAIFQIINSWNSLSVCNGPLLDYNPYNSIGALGWQLSDTFMSHLKLNIIGHEGEFIGLFWQPVWMLLIYYFCSNFIFTFHKRDMKHIAERKLAFSAVYVFTLICMLPLFTVLSCDYGRLYQYLTITAFASLLIIPCRRLLALFPKFFLNYVSKFNLFLERLLPPSKRVMILMLFFVGMSPCYFSLSGNLIYSVAGKIFSFCGKGIYFAGIELYELIV